LQVPRDDVVSLLARMLDLDRPTVRAGVARMFGQPADLDAELARFGGELLDLAARDADAFRSAIAQPSDPAAISRGTGELRGDASSTLSARLAREP